jgi:hypothetical protein
MTLAESSARPARTGEIYSRALPEWTGVVATVTLAAVLIAPNLRGGMWLYDGGIAASAGTFLLHGLVPYRDFWLLYGPLGGAVVALPTAAFGPSDALLRVLGIVTFVSQAIAGYLIARIWVSRPVAVIASAASVAMVPAVMGLEVSAWPLSMAFGLFAIYVAIGTARDARIVGLLVGLAFLTRLDVGAYALIATLLVRDRGRVLVGFAMLAVPIGAVAVLTTGVPSLVEQLIWYPLIGQREFRALPGPDAQVGSAGPLLSVVLVWIPRILIVSTGARILANRLRGHAIDRERFVLTLVVFVALCQLQTSARADLEHLAEAAAPAMLLLPTWLPRVGMRPAQFLAFTSVTACCIVVGLLGLVHLSEPRSAIDQEVIATSAWIREGSAPDEPLFVGLTSHEYTTANPLLIYYLADRRPAVRDTMFNPGLTNTDPVQERMVHDLEASTPAFLVLDRSMADRSEDTNDSRIPGSTILDTFIRSAYHPICDTGDLVIQARNDLNRALHPCPVAGD